MHYMMRHSVAKVAAKQSEVWHTKTTIP